MMKWMCNVAIGRERISCRRIRRNGRYKMSQIEMQSPYDPQEKVDTDEAANILVVEELDEMDVIMSQIEMQSPYDPQEKVDTDEAGIPQELLYRYQEAMSVIDDDIISQMADEADPEIDPELPSELLEEYEKAMGAILPKKSKIRYEQAYNVFQKWQESYRTTSLNKKLIMAYFGEASKKYKPTLWSMYSMLKKTLIVKHNVDLKNYCRLRAFLKTNSDGYRSKHSLVFTPEQIKEIIIKAPDVSYLAMKVVLIFGVIGTCRGDDLTNLTVGNVKDDGNEISVHIPWTKTKVPKDYIIAGEFAKIIREYVKLRPTNAKTDRLFMQYRNEKCVNQVMGKHSIAKIPKEIASFLKLPDQKLYTGHSFRGTSTTIAADAGASMEDLKRLGPWKSIYVCEQYIRNSKAIRRKMSNLIGGAINLPSTSATSTSNSGNGFEIESSSAIHESCNENDLGKSDTPMNVLSEVKHSDTAEMASDSDTVKLISAAVKPLSETLKGLGFQKRGDKENVILHFGGECKNFTIINLN